MKQGRGIFGPYWRDWLIYRDWLLCKSKRHGRYIRWRDLIEGRCAASRKEQFKRSPDQRKAQYQRKINETYAERIRMTWFFKPSGICGGCFYFREEEHYAWEELPEELQRKIAEACVICSFQ